MMNTKKFWAIVGALAAATLILGLALRFSDAGKVETVDGVENYQVGSLVIEAWSEGKAQGDPSQAAIDCSASANLCEAIATTKALQPIPADMGCTMVYGGPQEANVQGSISGVAIDLRFSRTNGCSIAQWDTLDEILGAAGIRVLTPPVMPSN